MRNISFTDKGWSDLLQWSKTDRKIFFKITNLIEEASRNPYKGTGKPELLKNNFKGYWSRRITDEHRLIYSVNDEEIKIVACKYHYKE
jgi:toxin YoeB